MLDRLSRTFALIPRQLQDSFADHSSQCHIGRLVPVLTVGHDDECLKTARAEEFEKDDSVQIQTVESTVILDCNHLRLDVNTKCMGREISETRFIVKIVKCQLLELAQAICFTIRQAGV